MLLNGTKRTRRTGRITLALTLIALAVQPAIAIEHVEVIFEAERFAGWPANNGIWIWGDEVVVGFTLGYHKPSDGHPIDRDRPSGPMQARSLDGGHTWSVELPSFMEAEGEQRPVEAFTSRGNFTHPDFAARFSQGDFFFSHDRAKTWDGPFALPDFGRPSLLARTDYIVNGKRDLTAFIASSKDGGNEGWPLVIRTKDGGQTWNQVGWIGEQPPEGYGYAIMPSTVQLKTGGLLSMIRRGGVFDGERRWWIEPYLSPDEGASWYKLDEPYINNAGNPAAMIRLQDGRIALTYGWRTAPYGMRARISDDEGQTWGEEFILRSDGGGWDLGYPRSVQRSDGKCLTIYYFNDGARKERHIVCTIWDPSNF